MPSIEIPIEFLRRILAEIGEDTEAYAGRWHDTDLDGNVIVAEQRRDAHGAPRIYFTVEYAD